MTIDKFTAVFMSKLGLFATLFLFSLTSEAAPDNRFDASRSLLEQGQAEYQFIEHVFSRQTEAPPSLNNIANIRVTLAIPKRRAPESGYPVLYFLDGNAALMDVKIADLRDKQVLPVMVFVGYNVDTRFDFKARTYDYTPLNSQGEGQFHQWLGGGAAGFSSWLTEQLVPWVATQVRIDKNHVGLWGHSFGGVQVLYTLLHHPESFSHFFAIDPAIWWGDGDMLAQWEATQFGPDLSNTQLYLVHAESDRNKKMRTLPPLPEKGPVAPPVLAARLSPDAHAKLLQFFDQQAHIKGQYIGIKNSNHGALFPMGLSLAIGEF